MKMPETSPGRVRENKPTSGPPARVTPSCPLNNSTCFTVSAVCLPLQKAQTEPLTHEITLNNHSETKELEQTLKLYEDSQIDNSSPSSLYDKIFPEHAKPATSVPTSLSTCHTTAITIHTAGSDICKSGYLRKLRHNHRRYFVLRRPSHTGPSRLEYYDSEKKFRSLTVSGHGSGTFPGPQRKRVIYLQQCFSVNKRADARNKHLLALYTKDDYLVLSAEDEEEQEEWFQAVSGLMQEERSERRERDNAEEEEDDGYWTISPSSIFKEVWPVTVKPRGLGQTKSLTGVSRLCLSAVAILLVRVSPELPSVTLPLLSIRCCGHSDSLFYVELGRSAPTGPGEIWLQAGDQVLAQSMHETVLDTMRALRALPDFRLRSLSQSLQTATPGHHLGVSVVRRHLLGAHLPPRQTGLQRPTRTEPAVGSSRPAPVADAPGPAALSGSPGSADGARAASLLRPDTSSSSAYSVPTSSPAKEKFLGTPQGRPGSCGEELWSHRHSLGASSLGASSSSSIPDISTTNPSSFSPTRTSPIPTGSVSKPRLGHTTISFPGSCTSHGPFSSLLSRTYNPTTDLRTTRARLSAIEPPWPLGPLFTRSPTPLWVTDAALCPRDHQGPTAPLSAHSLLCQCEPEAASMRGGSPDDYTSTDSRGSGNNSTATFSVTTGSAGGEAARDRPVYMMMRPLDRGVGLSSQEDYYMSMSSPEGSVEEGRARTWTRTHSWGPASPVRSFFQSSPQHSSNHINGARLDQSNLPDLNLSDVEPETLSLSSLSLDQRPTGRTGSTGDELRSPSSTEHSAWGMNSDLSLRSHSESSDSGLPRSPPSRPWTSDLLRATGPSLGTVGLPAHMTLSSTPTMETVHRSASPTQTVLSPYRPSAVLTETASPVSPPEQTAPRAAALPSAFPGKSTLPGPGQAGVVRHWRCPCLPLCMRAEDND